MWTGSTGLGLATTGGHESVAIRRALSQRRAGGHWVRGGPAGIESSGKRWAWVSCGRRRHLPRTAGSVSRGRRAWGSGNPGTREPAGGLGGTATREPASGLGIATAGGGYLPRSAGMRARGQRTHLPQETKHRKQIKTRKNEQNKTRWRGAAYGWVWSSVTVHTAGRNKDTQTTM